MDRERELRAREIFLDALDVEPEDRQAFVAQAALDDPSIGDRAAELLAAHAGSSELFNALDQKRGGAARRAQSGIQPGTELGAYRILSTLGSGGFGTVYLAEQTAPVVRRVALKVMRSGMRSTAAHVRFAAERQALARMEHPGIAQVFDAGETPDGLPFFAMEFVAGQSIIEYCDTHRLRMGDRLQLFEDVCHAVAHAHQRGVLHRDIKPSNVLALEIDGRAHVKVIDFGIAKAIAEPLTQDTLESLSGELMGTPAYMSPEQAAGEPDIDTRTDVYSLGALLYELLAGAPPFDSADLGLARLLQAILDDDPPLPSRRQRANKMTTWTSRVPADLDWIAMRCLEKRRDRRYSSAAAVAVDVRNFLDGRPVEAAPPGTWYRAFKLARRHRWLTLSGVALTVACLIGAFGIGLGLVKAREERDVAESILEFLREDLLAAAQPTLIAGRGKDVKLLEVVNVAAKRLEDGVETERFEGKPRVSAAIRSTLGELYGSLGEFERSHAHMSAARALYAEMGIGDSLEALRCASYQVFVLRGMGRPDEAIALAKSTLAAQAAAMSSAAKDVIQTRVRLAFAINAIGKPREAVAMAEQALHDLEEQKVSDPELLTLVHNALAIAHSADGDLERAEHFFRLQHAAEELQYGPASIEALTAEGNLAANLQAQGRNGEAEAVLQRTIGPMVQALGEHHPSVLKFRRNLGHLLLERNDIAGARVELEFVLEASEETYGPGHVETSAARAALGECLAALGSLDEAEEMLRHALEESRLAVGVDSRETHLRRQSLITFLSVNRPPGDELVLLAEEQFASRQRVGGPAHASTLLAEANLAYLYSLVGRIDLSELHYRSALKGSGDLLGRSHPETLETHGSLVDLLRESGRLDEAEECALDAMEAIDESPPSDPVSVAKIRARLGFVLVDADRNQQAKPLLEESLAVLEAGLGPTHVWTRYVVQVLEELDAGSGKPSGE